MSISQNQTPNEPSIKDLLDHFKSDVFKTLNCHHVATVQSFNAVTQTASAQVNYKKTFFQLSEITGAYEAVAVDYPLLVDAPVIVLGGGGARLSFPIAKGDECLVLFNDRDIDNWFQGTSGAVVASPRLHSFSDCILLVGLRSLPKALLAYDTARAALEYAGAKVAVGGGGGKVLVTNAAAQSLGALLQNLCTQLGNLTTALTTLKVTGVTVGGGTSAVPDPTTLTAVNAAATAITGIKTQLAGLLE